MLGRHARFEKREADFLRRTRQMQDAQDAKEAEKRAMQREALMQRQAVIEAQRQERAMTAMRLQAKLSKRNELIEKQVKERQRAMEIAKLEKRDARESKRANVDRSKRRHQVNRDNAKTTEVMTTNYEFQGMSVGKQNKIKTIRQNLDILLRFEIGPS